MNILADLVLSLVLGSTPVQHAIVDTAEFSAQKMRDIGGVRSCTELKVEQNALVKRIKKEYALPESVTPFVPPKVDDYMTEEDVAAYREQKPATRIIEIQNEYKKRCML